MSDGEVAVNSRKGRCGQKKLKANGDFVFSAYTRLLRNILLSSRYVLMTSTKVPTHVGIISAGEVHRTLHPSYT